MAASGSGSHNLNQYPAFANANETLLKTIPLDFRFKSIGQAPGLLHRITTPDPEIPLPPSPSPPASPQLNSSQNLVSDNQAEMKPKASLFERITGSSVALPSQAEAAGPSQSILAARPTRVNAVTETGQSTAISTQPRSASLEKPSPNDDSNTVSRALPNLDTVPKAPAHNSAMDVDTHVNGGPGSGQALPSISTSNNVADPNMAASASPTARKVSQSAGGHSLSPYAALRNRMDGISGALSSLPTVDTQEAARLLELATAQSYAALKSANHAQERTTKALECLQEAMKVVADCNIRVQESDTRTNAAMAAVAALTGTRYEEERQRFLSPILHELAECRQSLDRMEELYQKQRQMRAQRQMQVATQPTPATTVPAVNPAVASDTTPAVAPAVDAPATSVAPLPALSSSDDFALATEPNATGSGSQAVKRLSLIGDQEQSPALIREQKRENQDLTWDDGIKLVDAERKALEEMRERLQEEKQKRRQEQKRLEEEQMQQEEMLKRCLDQHQAVINGIIARMPHMQQKAPAAVAQNLQATYAEDSPQTQQAANGQPNNDRMMIDGEDDLTDLRDETRSAISSEVRQRTIKERPEAERQTAERLRSEEDNPLEVPTLAAEEKSSLKNDEDGHRRVQQQKQSTLSEEAKNTKNSCALSQQTSPTETVQAPVQLNNESALQMTGTPAEPNTTKPPRQTGPVVSGNVLLGAVNESFQSKRKANIMGTDNNMRYVDTKNPTPSQSRPNTLSPTARYHPLPGDTGHSQKHCQQLATVEEGHSDPSITANSIPIPVMLAAGLPPRPQPLVRQAQLTTQNLAATHAIPIKSQQVAISSSTDQHASQLATGPQENEVVIKREPDQDDEDIKPAQWDAGAPMTPDSLPSDNGTGQSGTSHQIKREGSIGIPRLSLPSPPPPAAPPATASEVFPQTSSQQHKAVDDARPELFPKIHSTYIASGTEQHDDINVPNIVGPGQHTHDSSNSQPFLPPGSPPYYPPDAPRIPPSMPATRPVAVRREFTPTSPRFAAMGYPPLVPALVVTEADAEARTNPEPERGWGQSIPESHSSNSLNSDRRSRSRPGPQRRIGSDHYSPSPPPRRSRSRSRSSRPLPPRGDYYSPRRRLSPAPRYSGGYSMYSADRSRSRGPMSATNSRNASPNPYTPPIGQRQLPLGPANQGQKRAYPGDMPQGPPSRRPRYDESRDDAMQTNPSRLYVPGRETRDERSDISNRAPSPAEYRPRPLGERLGPDAPSEAPQSRGRQLNYDSNNRYDNRRHFSDYDEGRYAYDRPPERRPPPSYQEIPPPANATGGAPRPDLLSRLGNSSSSHDDSDYNSYFHQQPTNNHPSNYHSTRGGPNPRRGRGAGPTTPRGGKNSLINRIEG